MGAWKDWQIGMIEDGATEREIEAAESRIKGTRADPLVRRLLDSGYEPSLNEAYVRIFGEPRPVPDAVTVRHRLRRWAQP